MKTILQLQHMFIYFSVFYICIVYVGKVGHFLWQRDNKSP